MGRERSVSPVGASRFERPFTPHSQDTSPTSVQSALQRHFHGKSSHSSRPSTTRNAPDTPATSIDSPVTSFEACRLPPPDADEWFRTFRDDLEISDNCPDRAELAAAQYVPVYDAQGKARSFGSLYDPMRASHERQLIIFVRHFYCGACQAYLKALTESITTDEYFRIPIPTSITVIGCGQPHIIPHYRKFSGNCPFPIYADPTRQLYKKLGMHVSFNIGKERPEYMKDISTSDWGKGQIKTISASLKDPDGIRKRDILKGGNGFQIGGEFLFEDGEVIWCHRMKNFRNHAEVSVVRKILDLDD